MKDKFVGIQLGAHSVYDEGIDQCLDLIQETSAANALLVYSYTHVGFAAGRTPDAIAPDHGVLVRDPAARRLPMAWVEPHDEHYAGTILRNRRFPEIEEYADRDILADLAEPARKRGMRLYTRILEGSGQALAARIPNWPKVLTVDVYGQPNPLPCWNNPDYRNWWVSTVADLFSSYPLDGMQWGAERVGPLPLVLYRGVVPTCFCGHCQAKARAQGIAVERAQEGYRQLHEFISTLMVGQKDPVDGALVTMLRLWLKYPEILAWERLWRQSKEELAALTYGTAKAIRPAAQIGRHLDHQQSTWDLIYRAEWSNAEIANYCDFLKPIAYHDIAGPRIRWWHVNRLSKTILRELSEQSSLEMFYDLSGLDKDAEPGLDELNYTGLSPDYVYRLTKRLVDGVQGKTPIYPGIGFDVPWSVGSWDDARLAHFKSDPELVYQATLKAFEAGAQGIVISREYDEMRVPNLRAVKRAVADAAAAGW